MTLSGLNVWKIRGRGGEYFVAARTYNAPPGAVFIDPPTLASDLDQHCQDDPFGLLDLQSMLQAVDFTLLPGAGELCRPDSRRVIRDRLIAAFLREDLVVVNQGAPAREIPRGDAKGETPEPAKPPPPPAPPAPVATKTWIAIKLLNEAGKPCANERFKVTLPDGSSWEGKLDAEGQARKDGISDGPCKVTFPDLGPSTGKS